MMDAAQMRDFIREHFTETAFRWECLPAYEVASDGNDYGRYLRGEAEPTRERKQPWLDRLAGERARGLRRSRVRLLHDPLTDYERYECEWGYVPNAAAGEDVRIIRPGELPMNWLSMLSFDWWLIDDQHVIVMNYDDDGQFEGANLGLPGDAYAFRQIRDRVWDSAEPFTAWWDSRPELHRDARRKAA